MSGGPAALCPVMVGRQTALALLVSTLDDAQRSSGGTVFVSGEAGVGKSRLMAAVIERATARDLLVLRADCVETDRSVAYGVLLELLQGHSAELAAGFPELVDDSNLTERPETSNPRRLASSLADVISAMAAQRPALVLVEDVHWCDSATLEVLRLLARRLPSMPASLTLTYRGDEVSSELGAMLSQLDRERLSRELRLEPLSSAQVAEMVQAIFDLPRPPRSAFVEQLIGLTEGNPFFVEELLKSLLVDGRLGKLGTLDLDLRLDSLHLPRTVQDNVRRRVMGLTPESRSALEAAAVAGRRFDFSILRDVLGRTEVHLLEHMKELVAAQLVVEETADRFAFRHALTREAVYSSLLARERRLLHGRIGDAMERRERHRPETVAELALHFHHAADWLRTDEYARRAAGRAQTLQTPRPVIEMLGYALEAAAHTGSDPEQIAELERQRATAFARIGDFEAAKLGHERAAALFRAAGNVDGEWRAHIDLGWLWSERDYAMTRRHFEIGMELARGSGDRGKLAASLNALGNWHMNLEEALTALQMHEQALPLFESLADRQGAAVTLSLRGIAAMFTSDLVAAEADLTQAIALSRDLGDRVGLINGLAMRAMCRPTVANEHMVPASLQSPAQDLDEAITVAGAIDWRAGEAFGLVVRSQDRTTHGELAGAMADALEALTIAEEIEHQEWTIAALEAAALPLLALGDPGQARASLEKALPLAHASGSAHWVSTVTSTLALACMDGGDLAAAHRLLDTLALESGALTPGKRRCWYAKAALALADDRPTDTVSLLDELGTRTPNLGDTAVLPRASLLRGTALSALGRHSEAEDVLRVARAGAVLWRSPTLTWRVDAQLGRLHRRQRRRVDADAAFDSARTICNQLASRIDDPTLRATFDLVVSALVPPESPGRRRRAELGGLTERETEVATLIAKGLTNRQIGVRLFVSESTVESHVKHVLSKLEFASRAQIAVWAAARSLAEESDIPD